MKRFKNLVIGGIETKVFNLILITMIVLCGVFAGVSIYQNNMLTEQVAAASASQEQSIREVIGTVMNAVVDQSLDRQTEVEARLADMLFQGLAERVQMLEDYAVKLFTSPDTYPRIPASGPDASRNGEITAQLLLADGVTLDDAALSDRVGLAANMADMMVTLFATSETTNSCFIALPDGVFLVVDDRSAAKFDQNGDQTPYDPRTRPWYQQAVEQGGLIFTDVETDAFTGDIGIVGAMPVYVDGQLVAVVGSDLFLTSMRDAVEKAYTKEAYVCVINHKGHVVFSPLTEGVFSVQPGAEAADLRLLDNAELAAAVNEAMQNKTALKLVNVNGEPMYIMGAPMKTIGWALLSVCSQQATEQPAVMLQDRFAQIEAESTAKYQGEMDKIKHSSLILLIIVMLVLLGITLAVGKRIVHPLNVITRRISELKEGNLEFKMEDAYRTGDEIQELAESFAALSHKTVQYVDEVKTVTAEKERIGTELSVATGIQRAMMPHIFPAFPDRPDFDVYASMDPAKEVGGDFYDYFLIDDDHLCLVIADVSGKGVPAALFMMASKIILQSVAMLGKSVAEILERTNEAICSNNEAEMFVTVWLGILELSTGKLKAANAGHEYPMMRGPNGKYEIVKDKHGFVIGGLEGMRYKEYEIDLKPGSRLFVYTDGVTEATNADKELFGMDRLLDALNIQPDAAPNQVLKNVRGAIDGFVKDAEQFDDLTMLCIEYNGKDGIKAQGKPKREVM